MRVIYLGLIWVYIICSSYEGCHLTVLVQLVMVILNCQCSERYHSIFYYNRGRIGIIV